MTRLWDILKPKFLQYKTECLLVVVAFSICLASVLIYIDNTNNTIQSLQTMPPDKQQDQSTPDMITVEIAGAVERTGVYKVPLGSRIHDLVTKAGGLTGTADPAFVSINLNQALILSDQQKVFIPSIEDSEALQKANHDQPILPPNTSHSSKNSTLNLNEASVKELEGLPGVGTITAEKIIGGRPYINMEELVNKKIVGDALFNKIKDSLSIQ